MFRRALAALVFIALGSVTQSSQAESVACGGGTTSVGGYTRACWTELTPEELNSILERQNGQGISYDDIGVIVVSAEWPAPAEEVSCNQCELQSPPGDNDKALLNHLVYSGAPTTQFGSYKICNAEYCAEYQSYRSEWERISIWQRGNGG